MDKDQVISEINRLKQQKKAVIMAHYYQENDIQDIADVIGDSLALAQEASKTDAEIIVLCGVHFMGETAKIICPDKKVLIPDVLAGCSLADSCPAKEFEAFVKSYPDHTVISYVNTSAEVKALTDIVVTSTNATAIVNSLPSDEKIIFGPDKNLGNYINNLTGRNMLLWNGACHVHEQFSVDKIIELRSLYPTSKLIAHPECKQVLLNLADFIGSTSSLIKYAQRSDSNEFIVATESGILHEMRRLCPDKVFIPAPPEDVGCACNECSFMRLNTLEKVLTCLITERPAIEIPSDLQQKALKPILRMLELSATLQL
jgi:quinolinate synthase